MITALLIIALVLAALLTISIAGWAIGQGFFFWFVCGSQTVGLCLEGCGALLSAILDSFNN